MENVLEIKNLSITYTEQQKEVVKNCSFTLGKEEILGIVGESGSGKTTMVMSIPGFLKDGAKVTGGKILFQREDITPPISKEKSQKLRGGKIAVIMQNAMSCLDPLMKIGDQIVESIRMHTDCTKEEAKQRAIELLDLTGIQEPEKCMKKYPFECSGGMQQRICIAIALSGNPEVLIADEPTTALDVTIQAQILNLLRRISRDLQLPIILISHDLGVVSALCTRLLIMHEGKIVEEGETKEIFRSAKDSYTKELLAARRQIEKEKNHTFIIEETRRNNLLRTEEIQKSFQKKRVLKGISIEIAPKQVYGLAGESGCGKSTFARTVMGIYPPDSGKVYWEETEIGHLNRRKRAAYSQKMQMIFQNPYQALNPAMTIEENLREVLLVKGISEKEETRRHIHDNLLKVGIEPERMTDYPEHFSGGQLQRITIARALLLEPELLICDEPFSGLDIAIQKQLADLLKEMKDNDGFSMLFIGHDLVMLENICDMLGIMYDGMIVEEGPAADVAAIPWHPYTKNLFLAAAKVKITGRDMRRFVLQEEAVIGKQTKGCPYAESCRFAKKRCFEEVPEIYQYQHRKIRCFLYDPAENQKRDENYQMTVQI